MRTVANRLSRIQLAGALLAAIAACGGDDDGGDDDASHEWQEGVFEDWHLYAARCESPRAGTADQEGSIDDEKLWLRNWIHDLYLWFDEVPDPDPAAFSSSLEYFDVLRTPARTESGKDKDQFHFTYDTEEWERLSQSGVSAGYGVQWAILAGSPPREVVAAYTEPDSPADAAGIARGARVVSVDGVPVEDGDPGALNAGLFPADIDETHELEIEDLGADATRTVTVTSEEVASAPVQNVHSIPTDDGLVGYMLFNDHLGTAERALIDAIQQLSDEGVTDLVIDMRYNGGGYIAIASELGYMVAGPPSEGKTFEKLIYNAHYPDVDPFDGQPNQPETFRTEAVGFSADVGEPLPTLTLERVFVLTGPGTCSASESVMNGLRGIDVEVIQIGETTCGKPYGFVPQDNCGTTWFSIEFQGVNEVGFGDYADGFTPAGDGSAGLPGCVVADDFTHELGDPAEARLSAALTYRVDQTCPPAAAARGRSRLSAVDGQVVKSPWQQNRIYGR